MTLLTAKDVAKQLKCSEVTVRRLARRGQLPHHKFGRLVRFPEDAVEMMLKSGGKSVFRGNLL